MTHPRMRPCGKLLSLSSASALMGNDHVCDSRSVGNRETEDLTTTTTYLFPPLINAALSRPTKLDGQGWELHPGVIFNYTKLGAILPHVSAD